jgi:hypothetical protein
MRCLLILDVAVGVYLRKRPVQRWWFSGTAGEEKDEPFLHDMVKRLDER